MAAPAANPDQAAAADADERECVRCGYLLRGLPDDSLCPECGANVSASAGPIDLLRDQDPAWLGRVAEGLLWQIGGNLLGLASVPLSVFIAWRQQFTPEHQRFPLPTVLNLLH